MENLNQGKDKSAPVIRPNRFSAFSHLLVGGGVFILCAYLLTYAAAKLMGFSILDMQNSEFLDGLMSSPQKLKLFTFLTSSLPLIAAALLTLLMIKAGPRQFLLLYWPLNQKWLLLSMVFIFLAIPLMGPLLQINELIDFSRWPDLYSWLQAQEATNNKLYESMVQGKGGLSLLSSILFMALFPALAEELFFRGFLMNVLNGLFKNIHVAIFVTALIFSLMHLQFLKIIPMFFMAMVFGYAVYWTNSIWTSVIAHFLNNSLAVFQLHYVTDGSYEEALSQGQQFPIYVSVIIAVVVIGLFTYIQKRSDIKLKNFYV